MIVFNKNKGFTLIELLVVISIISFISSIIFASLTNARSKAKTAAGNIFSNHTMNAFGADEIGMWNFDDGAVTDSSGNGRNGSLINGAVIDNTSTPNNSGKSLKLSGANYASISTNSNLISFTLNTATIGAWIKLNKTNGLSWQGIVTMNGGYLFFGLSVAKITTYPHNTLSNPSEDGSTGYGPALNDGFWHYVAATYKFNTDNGSQLYVDGQAVGAPFKYTIPSNVYSIFIGSADLGAGQCFGTNSSLYSCSINPDGNSYIDDVVIYSQSLTASAIQNIYAQGLPTHSLAQK
jgi:prepilin-type N-terminal cleavage/methylation domain-containing protein